MKETAHFNLPMLQVSKPPDRHLEHSDFDLPIGNDKECTIKLVLRI